MGFVPKDSTGVGGREAKEEMGGHGSGQAGSWGPACPV